jgi:hypothetical protein
LPKTQKQICDGFALFDQCVLVGFRGGKVNPRQNKAREDKANQETNQETRQVADKRQEQRQAKGQDI